MKEFKRFSVLAVTVAVMMLFATSMVTDAHAFGGNGRGHMMGWLLKGLDLTDAQKQSVKDIMLSHHDAMLSGKLAELQARQDLMTATTAPTYVQGSAGAAYDKVAKAERDMAELRALIFSQIWPILTPEQQTTVTGKIAKADARTQQAIVRLQTKLSAPAPQPSK